LRYRLRVQDAGANVAQSQAAKLAGTLVLALAALSGAPDTAAAAVDRPKPHLLDDAVAAIRDLSVAPVDEQTLLDGALDGMTRSLNGAAEYISPKEYERLGGRSGQTVGVGLTTNTADGAARIVLLLDGGAAAKAGLRLGDYIVAVDGRGVLGDTDARLGWKLSGAPGSTVKVTIIRDMRERLEVDLVRDAVAPKGMSARMEGDYAYLRLTRFDEQATDKLDTALRDLKRDHPDMKGLVLDLRDNPGGLLDQCVSVSDAFLGSGLVFSLRGRKPEDNKTFVAHAGDMADGLPMAVLINSGTAAGAEIVASALQDNHRAKLVGQPSFGRGSIQTVLPLGNGANGALKVTTAYFYRPSGAAIEGVGVKPDIVAPQTSAADPDAQLARAIALLKAGG
jgi:carboxyl-terminal processing protease